MRSSTTKLAGLLLGGALLWAGCGATPPQVPVPQANRVSAALTGIAEACGESHQRASRPGPRASASLEAAATLRARELAKVFRSDPKGVYQAQTLRQVVAQAIADLDECGLRQAATALRGQTR